MRDIHNPSSSASSVPSSLGLYVDDFVYFSEDPEVESLFERLLWERVKVDFMGLVEWFLGIHFSWRMTSSRVNVHLNQTGFATNLVEQFCRDSWDATLMATPFLIVPGFLLTLLLLQPMLMILPHNFVGRRHIRLIGSIGWLATVTWPDLAPVHSFLLSYNYKPSSGHMCAALHVLHYSLNSRLWDTLHIVFYGPGSHVCSLDVETYTDTKPPLPSHLSPLTSYSDACWGSQIGSAIRDGTLLPLFKCQSMSGGIIFRQGGPIAWTAVRQERTSLSSCEAKSRATNEVSKLLMGIRHLADDVREGGNDIADTAATSPLYNDNESCAKWSHNMTTKQIRHMEMRENAVREWVQDSLLKVLHVPGRITDQPC